MPGRLAIDFGTSNTVLAVWDETRSEGVPLLLPDFGKSMQVRRGQTVEPLYIVPSLIHYAEGRRWIGKQVHDRGLYESPLTFRWMKRYVSHRSPFKIRLGDREISHDEAGRDFLKAVLLAAVSELNLHGEEVALTVPVEAFEHYEDWLTGVAESAGLRGLRLIDEPSAAALGYGVAIQPNDVYLIFDFGGGTLDVSLVLIEEGAEDAGRRCRVLGKAGTDLGGAVVDHWMFAEVLRVNDRSDADEEVRRVSRSILVQCEKAKETLSLHDQAEIAVTDAESGVEIKANFTRSRFEELLDEHEALTLIDKTIRRALNAARERGYGEDQVKAVLLVGGSSLIPCVQRVVRRIFGRERVYLERPLDAVARGGAAFVAGVDFYDHIQHDYAIRFTNFQKGDYDYRVLVERGTPFPTKEPVARMTIKATHQGQAKLGIAIFELGAKEERASGAMELVFDPTGAARLKTVTPDEDDRRQKFWVNEKCPTFLSAEPPALPGEPRFEVEFGIDHNKRLILTARDLQTGEWTHRDHPVVKLS